MTLPKKGLKKDLEKLTKDQLIELLLKQKKPQVVTIDDTKPTRLNRPPPIPEVVQRIKPIPPPRTGKWENVKPKPIPRKSVKQMVKEYEDIIQPPEQFRPIPKPRTDRPLQMRRPPKPTRKPPPIPEGESSQHKITQLRKALKGSTKSFAVDVINIIDPMKQLNETKNFIKKGLVKELLELKGFKYIETLKVTFEKKQGKGITTKTAFFNSKTKTLINAMEINEVLQSSREELVKAIAQWLSEGSGWTIQSVDAHYINLTKYKPLQSSSYIELPTELRNPAKGLINLKNKDEACFGWCHVRHLNPKEKDPQRIKKDDNRFIKDKIVNYTGIKFPVTIKQYNKIEKQNNININVFGYEEKQIYPIYISKEKFIDHMELLLITEGTKTHYVLIKDFNKLMYNQTKHKERKHFCMHCLQCFSSERVLNNHKGNCIQLNGTQAVKMPTKDNSILKFNNYHKQQPTPFVIYADIEALLQKVERGQPDSNESYTERFQRHVDCGSAYKVVCCYDDKYSKDICIYRGENAVYKFLEQMLEEVNYCKDIVKRKFNKPLKMTDDDELSFRLEDKCHICGEKYTDKDVRVRDHCHITGKFRGSAHQECNLKLRIPENIKIPVIFHNLRGYDSHFLMQEIGAIVKKHTYKNYKGREMEMQINAIPNNMEKYMAFMLGDHLVFLDSFQFMSLSLDKLVSNLPKDDLKYTSQAFKGRRLELMTRKGVYPYDFMDSFEKFNQKELPTKEDFYSILNDQHISDEDYQHAKKVWNVFKCKNMGQYHDLYLGSDVFLLDVFESFRRTCLQYYKLDPCHYFTSPGLSWDAMLKMTKVELELMTDIDMYQFIEKGMRGGISYISHRHGLANNKYMKGYDEKAPSKYLMYLDANNLYGWAMSQYLPTGNFKWMSKKKIDKLDLAKYKDDSKRGLILEVDLEYPKELHDLHNEYPLAPEKIRVTEDMLSNYCEKIAAKYNISTGLVSKLIPNLRNKEKYVLHYRNLQLYTNLGLKVTKVHRVLQFDQSPWLKQYIDFNTEKRKNAKNTFEKDFFKLMNNSVFGKTMENLRKRVDIRLVTSKHKLLKLSSKPTFVSSKIFNDNLVAVHKIKETLTLNRPAYVGMCILDLSKTLMYDFHYNYIKKKYVDKAKLLFTDTDSLTYEIQAEDVYQDFWNDRHLFDNSDYSESSPYFDKTNKKIIGKFKDEASGVPITEFIGLRSKMYSYVKENQTGGKTSKGIKKSVIKNDVKHEDYKRVLLNEEQIYHKMKTIRSQRHQLGSYEINKVSLSCFDDKRYLLADGISSLAYGHYLIKN